ncbi:Hcp family type VI secretion system effector [Enterobacteriaceae bacterium 4M9]|nr:Hcp family type VI secretion system effector [Enterobacteriaceae bacterium 4M9]
MANIIYLTIKGEKQGLISAGCSSVESIGNKFQSGHEDEIFILELTSQMIRSDNLALRPVQIRKPIDKATPLLAQAISNNEKLECTFLLYRTAQSGGNELYFKMKLSKATIGDIQLFCPNSVSHNEMQPQETVSFNYASVTWEHVMAGTSAYSLWEERIY